MTRNGKIARLPRQLREELNRRLDDGEQGKQLVAWLNGLPEVQAMLKSDFQGMAINEQNLCEWKQGGFHDWRRHQESLEMARAAQEDAKALAAETGPTPLTDLLAGQLALLLAKAIRGLESDGEFTQETRRELVTLMREWKELRAGDHEAARLKMTQEDWRKARANVEAEEARAAEEAEENAEEKEMAALKKKRQRCRRQILVELLQAQAEKTAVESFTAGTSPEYVQKVWDYIESETDRRLKELV